MGSGIFVGFFVLDSPHAPCPFLPSPCNNGLKEASSKFSAHYIGRTRTNHAQHLSHHHIVISLFYVSGDYKLLLSGQVEIVS
jgi:hypothetical protein